MLVQYNKSKINSKINSKEDKEVQTNKNTKIKKFLVLYGLLIFTIFVFIFFSIQQPRFASIRNILNLAAQSSIIGILALGLTNIIISGSFDISFASNATLVSIICPILITWYHIPLLVAYVIVLLISISISMINGFIVVKMGVHPFITTLGMSTLLIGISQLITGGSEISFPYLTIAYKFIGKGRFFGFFPVILCVYMILAILEIFFLEKTFKGRQFYAAGSNLQAATRVGINVNIIKLQSYFIMGIIAGIGGIALGSIFETGNPTLGEGYLFPTIIVTLLGAVFLKEGIPNVLGTVLASILMGSLTNGFTLLGYPLWVREATQGIILIIAVSLISFLKPGGIPPVVIGKVD